MAKGYVLQNPNAGHGRESSDLSRLSQTLGGELEILDVTKISDFKAFLASLSPEDFLVLCGGDGTLNHFVNDCDGVEFENEVYYYPTGSGNDFAHECGKDREADPFPISKYLKNLPSVTVNGKNYRFINGIGYGIDGYCCEVGDQLRATSEKPVNYTSIAIKGLLFHYKPTNAKVTVDGVTRTYKKVWLAPTMKGKYYGGGMWPAPEQDRFDAEGNLSVMVWHGSGKLKTLMVFPSLFKGQHVKHTECIEILSGKEITVEYDRPTALQIDGETVLGVTSYTAKA